MFSRPIRALVIALAVSGVVVAIACGDTDNDNKGVQPLTMSDAGCQSGGMGMPSTCDGGMDGGDMLDGGDGGMLGDAGGGGGMGTDGGDGGPGQCMYGDGGMDMTCACDAGFGTNCGTNMMGPRRVWVLETASGAEGLKGIDPLTDNILAMSYSMMNGFGGIAGTPESAVLSNDQIFSYVAFSNPAKLVIIDMRVMGSSNTPFELTLGVLADKTADIAWATDKTVIVTAETANTLKYISTDTKTVLQTVSATDLTGLLAPSTVRVNANRSTAVIASSNAAATKVLFVDIGATALTARNDRTITLVDGATTGTGPTLCNWMRNGTEGYCAVTGGTDSDAGVAPASLWHFTYGGSAKRVLTAAAPINDIVTSPDDQRLFITTGGTVQSFWIGGDAKLAPLPIQTATVANAYRMGIDATAQNLFVLGNAANGNVVKLRLSDLTTRQTFPGFANPETIYTVP